MPARSRLSFRLGARALGLLASLAMAEVGLRILAPQPTGPVALAPDPDVGVMPRASFSGRKKIPGVYDYRFSHTADGLRDTPASVPDASAPEVLILGDSFTYGVGVNDEETFASRIAEGLAARGTPVHVRNGGRPGAAPDYALRLLRARDWQPAVIVYAFYANDFADLQREDYFARDSADSLQPIPVQLPARERLKLRLSRVPGADALRSHSHVVGLLGRSLALARGRDGPAPGAFDLDTLATPVHAAREPQASRAADYLRRLRDETHHRGGRFVAVFLPSAAQVAAYRRTGQPSADEAAFLRILASLGTDGFTLAPALASTDWPIAALYFPETHWRPEAHTIAARAMLDPIQAALCVRDTALAGCATAPPDVRRIVAMRVGSGSGA
ncbi:MAG: GDSL-type esterase/lipase family protein [Bacteroidota bacterium]